MRFVKPMTLDSNSRILADEISKGVEAIRGVDGRFHWFGKAEGSTDYVKLIRSVPEELSVSV